MLALTTSLVIPFVSSSSILWQAFACIQRAMALAGAAGGHGASVPCGALLHQRRGRGPRHRQWRQGSARALAGKARAGIRRDGSPTAPPQPARRAENRADWRSRSGMHQRPARSRPHGGQPDPGQVKAARIPCPLGHRLRGENAPRSGRFRPRHPDSGARRHGAIRPGFAVTRPAGKGPPRPSVGISRRTVG